MKTIITTLPIYNKLSKQCFERGKHAGGDTPTPIICPRHRLPSFQWLDGTDGASSVTAVELMSMNPTDSAQTVTWGNTMFDTFVSSGFNITNAIASGLSVTNGVGYISLNPGQQIRVIGTLALNSGVAPSLYTMAVGLGTIQQTFNLSVGANNIIFTNLTGATTNHYFMISVASASNFTFTSTSVTVLNDYYNITSFFPTLPASHAITGDVYFQYKGETLKYLLPVGTYYLKITMNTGHVYYSDWFSVDCVYENLITAILNGDYETFTKSGLSIISAINTAVNGTANSSLFDVILGEKITVMFNMVLNSGTAPTIVLTDATYTHQDTELSVSGLNVIELIASYTGQMFITFYNAGNTNFSTYEILVIRSYSEKYLTINFHNDCDLGDILYHDGFTQTLWIKSEPMENTYPEEEEGVKNGEGQFVRTFARQIKKYLVRTNLMPDYMVEVFNRLKLHDTIAITDLVGDTNSVYNLEEEHEWIGTDKYYAKLDLTFDYDEAVVIAGCCNNIS